MKLAALLLTGTLFAADPFVTIPAGVNGPLRIDRGFAIMRTEVTVAGFEKFVHATGYKTEAETAAAPHTWRNPGFPLSSSQPVVYVTPSDAQSYCAWLGGRLPGDKEWEYAARAGASSRHFWGDSLDARYLWYRENSDGRPRKVGTKRPNAFGLYDVEGNVWEWTILPNTKEPTARRRGASWVSCENIDGGPGRPPSPLIGLSVGYGIPVKSAHRYDDIGFRCAKDIR